MKKQGRIFVISAASGSGKTTLTRRLLKECKNLVFSKSITTRPRRKDEKNNRDYIFVSKREFDRFRSQGRLLEWAIVFRNFYGTPKEFVEKKTSQGKDVVLVIDVQGAFQVKQKRPDSILIFILPPSFEELKKRITKRKSDDPRQINLRLKIARREIAQSKRYDYIVVNDNLNKAARRLKEIIE